MENRIKQILEHLDSEQTEKLLEEMEPLTLPAGTHRRIEERVLQRAGEAGLLMRDEKVTLAGRLKSRRLFLRAAAVVLAGILLFFGLSIYPGYDQMSYAIQKWFRFVPGHGIVGEEDPLLYALSTPRLKVENESLSMTLLSAVSDGRYISVSLYFQRKSPDASQALPDKTKLVAASQASQIVLGEEDPILMTNWSRGSGGDHYSIYGSFTLPENSQAEPDREYILRDLESGLEIPFTLKSVEGFSDLEAIGPTVSHNAVSVTAVPAYEEGLISVMLYPYNESLYKIKSFMGDSYNPVLTDEIHLSADGLDIGYEPLGSSFGPITFFTFKTSERPSSAELVIPWVTLESKEKESVKVTIPAEGESVSLNKKVNFKDSTVTVVSSETVMKAVDESGKEQRCLKLTMDFENLNPAYSLYWLYLMDAKPSGGFSWEFDEEGMATTYYYFLEDSDQKNITLTLTPTYITASPYRIPLW